MAGSSAHVSIPGVQLDTSVLDKMTKEIRPRASKVVTTYGWIIAGEAATNAPIDTSNLRDSILSESHMENDLLFIVQDGTGEPETGPGTGYGLFQELGFHHWLSGKFIQNPFMIPAIEHWRDKFFMAFSKVFE